MLATLNVEWLAWTVEAPPKVLHHDQKIVVQRMDGTSIPQIQLEVGQLEGEEKVAIKEGEGQQKGCL